MDSNVIMAGRSSSSGLTSIVAVGRKGEIGVQNDLPWRLKSDLRFFKKTTRDNLVIMGRKTFESIGGCLPHRQNIVLSHKATLFEPHAGCLHAHSVGETLFLREKHAKSAAFVIGGAETYKQFAPFVDRYLITVVDAVFPNADAFFDQRVIGDEEIWDSREIEVEKVDGVGADEYEFRTIELILKNKAPAAQARAEAIDGFRRRNHFLQRKAVQAKFRSGANLDEVLSLA